MKNASWIQNEAAVAIFQSLLMHGNFSLVDIGVYSNMIEFHYYGDKQNKAAQLNSGKKTYSQIMGTTWGEYVRLQAKLRKVGLMTYNSSTKQWTLRSPEIVVADSKEYQTATKPRQREIVKKITTGKQLSLDLVPA